eukprot:768527-Hanusia_phi.AAC.3
MVGRASITIPVAQEIFRFFQTNKAEAGPVEKWAPTQSSNTLAAQYGITAKAVRDIWNKRTWVHATHTLWTEEEKKEYLSSRNLCVSCKHALDVNGAMSQSCACRRLIQAAQRRRKRKHSGIEDAEDEEVKDDGETCGGATSESPLGDHDDSFDVKQSSSQADRSTDGLSADSTVETTRTTLQSNTEASLQRIQEIGASSVSNNQDKLEASSLHQDSQSGSRAFSDGWMMCPDRIGLFLAQDKDVDLQEP